MRRTPGPLAGTRQRRCVWQVRGRVRAGFVELQQLLQISRPGVALGKERLEVEQMFHRGGDRRELELRRVVGRATGTRRWIERRLRLLKDSARLHPGRDEHRRGAQAQAPEVEGPARRLARRLAVEDSFIWRHHVLIGPSGVVVDDEEQRLVPTGARSPLAVSWQGWSQASSLALSHEKLERLPAAASS